MKKILIFSLAYYPRFIGGAEVAIKEITDRLGEEYEFDMVTLRKHAPAFERVGKVAVYRVGLPWRGGRTSSFKFFPFSKLLFPVLAYRKAQSLHKQKKYDAIWSMMAAYAGFAALFFKLRNPRVPFLLTLQEGDPIPHIKRRAAPVYPLFRMIFTKADRLQAISSYLGDFGRSMGFRGPLEIIPNGVDVGRFVSASAPDKKDNSIRIVTTSRLVRKNAVDDIIRALPLLPEHVRFIVLGAGPDLQVLKSLVQTLGISGRVEFRGFVDHERLPGELKTCDIFVRPSRSEGMGNSFVEAMAAGLPVVATQEGGLKDFISPAVAWVVEKDHPDQIALQIKAILGNPEHTKQVIENARRMVEEKYDWNVIARDMREKVFSRLFT